MRTELAAADTRAAQAGRFFLSLRDVRSALDRLAPARCAALKENPRGLLERASTSSRKCIDADRARRRFHAGGACARPPPWVPPDHLGTYYFTGGNRRDLLPERSLLRIADVVARVAVLCVKHRAVSQAYGTKASTVVGRIYSAIAASTAD